MARRSLERSEEKGGVEEKEDERGRVSMGDMVCVWFDLNVMSDRSADNFFFGFLISNTLLSLKVTKNKRILCYL